MYEPNVQRVLDSLSPSDVVLDIGGWARPFNRANYVIDAEPYETRGYYGHTLPAQGGEQEHFTKATWIQRDMCDKTPFPFADKEIDFVMCSHTLEDIRDPLWVCAEINRIAKRGYIEMPSRINESCRGVEPGQVGWTHHRWLVEIEDDHVRFLMKYHMIHSHWRFSLPASYLRQLPGQQQSQWLFWEESFDYSETTIHGVEAIADELERFVQQTSPYPEWRLNLAHYWRKGSSLERRASNELRRILTGENTVNSLINAECSNRKTASS